MIYNKVKKKYLSIGLANKRDDVTETLKVKYKYLLLTRNGNPAVSPKIY